MLLGMINFLFSHLTSLLLKTWCTVTERADATRPVMATSEPSEAFCYVVL